MEEETMGSRPLRLAVPAMAVLAAFVTGVAVGQSSVPYDDQSVEQTLLASIDIAKAVDHQEDRELRLSRVTIAPHGHIGLHSHKDDPTVVYIVSGTLTNHHDDGTTEKVHAGQAFAEFGPKSHWVENTEAAPATFVFTSLSPRQ
jgi:quercetin dioxygenase-like cupin family protein